MIIYTHIIYIHIHIISPDVNCCMLHPGSTWRLRCRKSEMQRSDALSWRLRPCACRMRTGRAKRRGYEVFGSVDQQNKGDLPTKIKGTSVFHARRREDDGMFFGNSIYYVHGFVYKHRIFCTCSSTLILSHPNIPPLRCC